MERMTFLGSHRQGYYIKKTMGLGRRQVSQRRREKETREGSMTLGLTWISWTETINSSRSAKGNRISAPKPPLADDMGQCWRWKWDTFNSPHFLFLRPGDWLCLDLITGVLSKQKPTEFCRITDIPQVSVVGDTWEVLHSQHPPLCASLSSQVLSFFPFPSVGWYCSPSLLFNITYKANSSYSETIGT